MWLKTKTCMTFFCRAQKMKKTAGNQPENTQTFII